MRHTAGQILRGTVRLPGLLCLLLLCASTRPAFAHNTPFSYVDLRLSESGVEVGLEAYAVDFAHDLPDVDADVLMRPGKAEANKQRLFAMMTPRFVLSSGGQTLTPEPGGVTALPATQRIRLTLHYALPPSATRLHVQCLLFPYDPRHKTYLNIYQDGQIRQQRILDKDTAQYDYHAGSRQSIPSVIGQFVLEGIHHIFIGPDHILFIVGLMLLGGSLRQLLKIVSAFTIAHSITLCLATLNIVNPPPRIIEPTIALSIVFVGVHSLLTHKDKRDWRLVFAFCFGFIHGFGFANALREMELPRAALGWSLLSFNIGVECGQMCIVLAVSPLLALLHRRNHKVAMRVVTACSVLVIVAGAFWFVQRIVSPG